MKRLLCHIISSSVNHRSDNTRIVQCESEGWDVSRFGGNKDHLLTRVHKIKARYDIAHKFKDFTITIMA